MRCIVLGLIFILVSCEQPRTNRRYVSSRDSTKPSGTTIIYQNANTGDENSSGNDDKSTESPSTDNNDSSNTSSNNLIGLNADNENCNWSEDSISSFSYKNDLIGDFNLCRSSSNSSNFYFQIKSAQPTDICFYPVKFENGGINYLGDASCILANASNVIYQINTYKNRANFSHLEMNAVVMMLNQVYNFPYPFYYPTPAPTAFKDCMDIAFYTQMSTGQANLTYCEAFNSLRIHSLHEFN
tara:strand:+ start:120 stop:842 length:723 start_codon:yes stop_codon:yes gene_type:complete